jgi:hypothetical protein
MKIQLAFLEGYFIYAFIYALFNYSVSISGYIAPSDRIISE